MRDSGRKSHAYENAVLNLVEALTLRSRVGERFEGVVLEVEHDDEREGTVMVREPAVEAPVTGDVAPPGGRGRDRHAGRGRPGDPEGALHPRLDIQLG